MLGKCVTHLPGYAGTTLAAAAHRVRCAAAAQLALGLEAIADPQRDTPITPTLAHAGNARNPVPGEASLAIDVRAATVNERQRVDDALRKMQSSTGASMKVEGRHRPATAGRDRDAGIAQAGATLREAVRVAAVGFDAGRRRIRRQLHRSLGYSHLGRAGCDRRPGPMPRANRCWQAPCPRVQLCAPDDHRTTFQGGSA